MEMVYFWGRTIKSSFVLLIISFVFTITGNAQNIFLSDSPGVFTFGKFAQVQNFDGPAMGLNYSINGKTSVGINYGTSTMNNRSYRSMGILANFLIKNQLDGDAINVEVVPSFERKYRELSDQNLSLFSLAAGISRDFSRNPGINVIPRVFFSYLVSPSVGVTNFLSAGLDMSFGFELNSNVRFVVNPGMNVRLDTGNFNGIFTSGLLIH